MPGALYMGPSNSFGFGEGKQPAWGGNPVKPPTNPGFGTPVSPIKPVGPMPGSGDPPGTTYSGLPAQTTVPAPQPSAQPGNVLGPQAVRGGNGFDPAYLQNLATAIGGLFSNNKQGGNTMSINPLGDLSEISGPSGMEGNAPQMGLPLTWLQQALNGLGFSFGQPAAPTAPTAGSVGGGGNNGQGGRNRLLQ